MAKQEKKKGPVSSREAGEAKTEAATAQTEPAPEVDPPAPGETVTEKKGDPKEPSPAQAAAAKKARKLAPPIEKESSSERHAKRRSEKSAHESVIDRSTMQRGDLDSIPKVETWRVQKDKRISINQRPVLMRAGQIVTTLTHKLDVLRVQGVVLERVS